MFDNGTEAGGALRARVTAVYGEEFDLLASVEELRAVAAGSLIYGAQDEADLPVTGDWVTARRLEPGRAVIVSVLPRRTCISRRAAGKRNREQPLAANVDLAFLVCGLDRDFNPRRLERYLTLAIESRVEPVVVLSKADLCGDVDERIAEIRCAAMSAPVIVACATEGRGVAEMLACIGQGRTAVLLGSSGAGKSTLANALIGAERQTTSEVRESDGRGRHTTTRRELIPLPGGGALIDTPGLRELQLWAGADSVDEAFGDIGYFAAQCAFHDCRHDGEPGCAVAAALASGEIDAARWQSWRKLRREAERHETLADHAAATAQKQKIKAINRAMRQHYRAKGWRG